MPRHFKVHELLNGDELAELQAFAREPGRTIDELEEYLLARGFRVSRGAVHGWFRNFIEEDRFAASNAVATTIMQAAAGKDAAEISDAAILKLSQVVFEASLNSDLDTRDVQRLSGSLKNVITSKRHLEKLQEELAAKQRQAVEEAEKAAKSGQSAEAVVSKVREILGIGSS